MPLTRLVSNIYWKLQHPVRVYLPLVTALVCVTIVFFRCPCPDKESRDNRTQDYLSAAPPRQMTPPVQSVLPPPPDVADKREVPVTYVKGMKLIGLPTVCTPKGKETQKLHPLLSPLPPSPRQ